MLTGHDQRVALEHRPVVEEGDDVGIGVHDVVVSADLAGDDGAERAGPGHRPAYVGYGTGRGFAASRFGTSTLRRK